MMQLYIFTTNCALTHSYYLTLLTLTNKPFKHRKAYKKFVFILGFAITDTTVNTHHIVIPNIPSAIKISGITSKHK